MIIWFTLNTFFLVTSLAILAVLVDRVMGRTLVHLDSLRQLLYQAGMDVISLFSGWEQSKLDVERKMGLIEFEDRVLTSIDASKAIEMLKENRRLMQ